MVIDSLGAVLFGFAVGWLACRLLWQKTTAPWIHTLIALGGIVAAAAVLGLFGDATLFGWYAIGLILIVLALVALRTLLPNWRRQSWREMLAGLTPAATVSPAAHTLSAPRPADAEAEERAPIPASATETPPAVISPATSPVASPAESIVDEDTVETDVTLERKRVSRKPASQRKRATDE